MEKDASGPDPVDVHVGRMVRAYRQAIGLAQRDLADMLGVTFQQVQKYERGANRVSASKLYEIAKRLGIAPGVLFEGLDEGQARSSSPELFSAFMAQPGSHDLAEAFLGLSPEQKRAIVNITQIMSGVKCN